VNIKRIFSSYRVVLKDRVFLKFMIVGITLLGLELQMSNYISVRLSSEFAEQALIPWLPVRVDGVQMWGILRMENTILVVLCSGLMLRVTKKWADRPLLWIGVLLFTAGFMSSAVSNMGWVLVLATLILTLGELIWVPIHQTLLASLVNESKTSQYMAVNGLRMRGALVLGSLGLTLGAFVPSWFMALLYMLMGLLCLWLYAGILNVVHPRQAMKAEQASHTSSH
jgi:MFS transporter, DHA1 family, multidrug resistance protein B